ncbi:hypothetical protein J7L05_07640, partial [bacterium]|nr:hypothetical protein [bacterium]
MRKFLTSVMVVGFLALIISTGYAEDAKSESEIDIEGRFNEWIAKYGDMQLDYHTNTIDPLDINFLKALGDIKPKDIVIKKNVCVAEISKEVRHAIGFDYNNADISNEELAMIDFGRARESFDYVVNQYLKCLENPHLEIIEILDLCDSHPVEDKLKKEIDHYANLISELLNKIDALDHLIFVN